MRKTGYIIKLSGAFTGVVVGAGFASGREITDFFISKGGPPFLGVMASGVFFGVFGYILISVIQRGVNSAADLPFPNAALARLASAVAYCFALCAYFAMLSAASALGVAYGFPPFFGGAVLSAVCFAGLLRGEGAFLAITSVLTPLLVALSVFCALCAIAFKSAPTAFCVADMADVFALLFSALLYGSYNMITAVSAMLCERSAIRRVPRAAIAGVLGGAALCLMGAVIEGAMRLYPQFADSALPLFDIMLSLGDTLSAIYGFALAFAVITTAVGALFAVAEPLTGVARFAPVALGAIVCRAPFGLFTSYFYPLFGVFGVIELFYLVKSFISTSK